MRRGTFMRGARPGVIRRVVQESEIGRHLINVPLEGLATKFGIKGQYRPNLTEQVVPTTSADLRNDAIYTMKHHQEGTFVCNAKHDPTTVLATGAWLFPQTNQPRFDPGIYSFTFLWTAQSVPSFACKWQLSSSKNKFALVSWDTVIFATSGGSAVSVQFGPVELMAEQTFYVDAYVNSTGITVGGYLTLTAFTRKIAQAGSIEAGSTLGTLEEVSDPELP